MIKDFIYNDIVLYCKGWYQSEEGNVLKDLGYLFSKIYAWTPKTEEEVARMMMRVLDNLYQKKAISFNAESPYCFCGFMQEVKRRMWLYQESFDMSIITYVRSVLMGLSKNEIMLNPPHYGKKEHFRMGSLFGEKRPMSMTYTEMNRIAQKAFKYD